MLVQLPLCDLRSAPVGKGSDAKEGTGPPQSGFARQIPLYDLHFASVDKGSDAKEGTGPPQPPLRSATPPAIQLLRQGERCNTNDISQYKRKIRVCRMDFSRVGPCVRPQPSYISDEWPLLSKGLRGGKERSDREESLLRWMIASEDAKNPLQSRK